MYICMYVCVRVRTNVGMPVYVCTYVSFYTPLSDSIRTIFSCWKDVSTKILQNDCPMGRLLSLSTAGIATYDIILQIPCICYSALWRLVVDFAVFPLGAPLPQEAPVAPLRATRPGFCSLGR